MEEVIRPMNWQGYSLPKQVIQVGPLQVQRIPSSSPIYALRHKHYWRGYIFPLLWPVESISEVGKLIEVHTVPEFRAACTAYRASLEPGVDTSLAYYEVIDADA